VNNQTIDRILRNQEEIRELVSNLNQSNRNAEQRLNELRQIFAEHDLSNLALERPGLIERRINDATQNIFDDLECITDPQCMLSDE
jgi:hypothetical protein